MTSSTSGEQDRTAGTAPSDGAAIPSAYALAYSRIDNLGLGAWPARRARVRPDAVAWDFEGRATTYLEVHERTSRLADALTTLEEGLGC